MRREVEGAGASVLLESVAGTHARKMLYGPAYLDSIRRAHLELLMNDQGPLTALKSIRRLHPNVWFPSVDPSHSWRVKIAALGETVIVLKGARNSIPPCPLNLDEPSQGGLAYFCVYG